MPHGRDKPATRTSRFWGVTLFRKHGRYQAFVKVNGKRIHLGMWLDERAAAIARDRGVLHFDLDRKLNLPRTSKRLGPAAPGLLRQQARRDSKRDASSGYIGVSWDARRRRWTSVICTGGRTRIQIAQFDDEESAAIAYDRVAREIHGDKATLNFPERRLRSASVDEMRRWARKLFKKRKSSRYRGVVACACSRQPWLAKITCREARKERELLLGTWGTEEEAALAYDRAALFYLERYGREPELNFPERSGELEPAAAASLTAESYRSFKTTTSSRFRGVHLERRTGKWVARIKVEQRQRHLGLFDEEHDAALAYDRAALDAWGDRAKVNFHPETREQLGGMRLLDVDAPSVARRCGRARAA